MPQPLAQPHKPPTTTIANQSSNTTNTARVDHSQIDTSLLVNNTDDFTIVDNSDWNELQSNYRNYPRLPRFFQSIFKQYSKNNFENLYFTNIDENQAEKKYPSRMPQMAKKHDKLIEQAIKKDEEKLKNYYQYIHNFNNDNNMTNNILAKNTLSANIGSALTILLQYQQTIKLFRKQMQMVHYLQNGDDDDVVDDEIDELNNQLNDNFGIQESNIDILNENNNNLVVGSSFDSYSTELDEFDDDYGFGIGDNMDNDDVDSEIKAAIEKAENTKNQIYSIVDKLKLSNDDNDKKTKAGALVDDLLKLMLFKGYSDDILMFVKFIEYFNLFKYISTQNIELLMERLLEAGRVPNVLQIGLNFALLSDNINLCRKDIDCNYGYNGININNFDVTILDLYTKSMTSSMHEIIGMSLCSTPWTSYIHESLFGTIVDWFQIVTNQYFIYFNMNNQIQLIEFEDMKNVDVETDEEYQSKMSVLKEYYQDVENKFNLLHFSRFESFFIYITQLLARDQQTKICNQLVDIVEPIIPLVCNKVNCYLFHC